MKAHGALYLLNIKHWENMKQKLNIHEKKTNFLQFFDLLIYTLILNSRPIFLCWNFKFFGVCFIANNMIIV